MKSKVKSSSAKFRYTLSICHNFQIAEHGVRYSQQFVTYSSSILVRPLLQLLTTTTISWIENIGVMILNVYVHIYIVLLIVYPQFGKQSLLAPLIMSGVVRVLISKKL